MNASTEPQPAGVDLEEVRILRLQPGDILVVHSDRKIPIEDAQRIHANLREKFPEHEVLVFSEGLELSVARSEVS